LSGFAKSARNDAEQRIGNDGINAVRRMLGQSLIDPVRCERA
jgi:hypothetical protein